MPKVRIEYRFWSEKDDYRRYVGRGIDQSVDPDFWVTQRHKVLGEAWRSFTYSEEVDLAPGRHFIECRTSGYAEVPEYKWYVEVKVDGRSLGVQPCGRDKAARFEFEVGARLEVPGGALAAAAAVAAILVAAAVALRRR